MAYQLSRREAIKHGIAMLGLNLLRADSARAVSEKTARRPDIIFIYTDQQHAGMMSCAGNPWLKTPAFDAIAAQGIRFTRAYTTNPVCSPARVGMMTGRFPGVFQTEEGRSARDNGTSMHVRSIPEDVAGTTLAAHLKRAGYELIYGGKEHLPPPLRPTNLGFDDISNDERDNLAKAAGARIRAPHDKPYFMWLNFINPHDICFMALRGMTFADPRLPPTRKPNGAERTLLQVMKRPEGMSDAEFADSCPALPANVEPQQDEPQAIGKLLRQRAFRMKAREKYTDRDWRLHRWAYCRLTEVVDRQVQTVLDAVKESGRASETLVIMSSDHGDMDSSHRMEHKTALYEQAANVPFLAMWPGHIAPGQVNTTHLISTGLDLLPTVCDYAGITGSADPRGKSLRPLFEGKRVDWRDTLGVESEIGRMVVAGDGCKYIRYDFLPGDVEEQLLDLKADPGETRHVTSSPAYEKRLAELRSVYENEWFPE